MLYMSFAPSTWVFFIAILFGAVFGVLWDCCRIVRREFGGSRIVFISDICYFILVSLFTVVFFFIFTAGGFRFFVIIGELLGFILYYCSIERPFFLLLDFVLSKLLKLIHSIYSFLKKCFKKTTNVSERNIITFSKKSKKMLRLSKKSMYNIARRDLKKNKNKI